MPVPTAAQLQQIANLEAAISQQTTDAEMKAAVNALAAYRETVWNGRPAAEVLDDGTDQTGMINNAYRLPWTSGPVNLQPPLQPGNPPGAVELGS